MRDVRSEEPETRVRFRLKDVGYVCLLVSATQMCSALQNLRQLYESQTDSRHSVRTAFGTADAGRSCGLQLPERPSLDRPHPSSHALGAPARPEGATHPPLGLFFS